MRKTLKREITVIKETITSRHYKAFLFIENYQFTVEQEKEMMQKALEDIDNSYCLFAETTDKGIGVGIEAGYAKAKGKPVVYLRRINAEHSTTLSGIADFSIIYSDLNDLKQQIQKILSYL